MNNQSITQHSKYIKHNTRHKVQLQHSCQMRAAYNLGGVTGHNLLKMFPQYSKSAIYVHVNKPLFGEVAVDKRKRNIGRKKNLSLQDERKVKRSLMGLRKSAGSFTSKSIQTDSGVNHVSNRTIRRCLNRGGYYYLQSRKKGLLLKTDLTKRLQFCHKVRRLKITQQFWREGISFYLDGKGFEYKTNPRGAARCPSTREWRQKGEGLRVDCVAKGKKEGCTNANFMVAIAYNHGAVICKQYFGPITGEKFAGIIHSEFKNAFKNSENPKGKRFLMDGCPRQNSKIAKKAMAEVGGVLFAIPARSPDLNPIENFFHLVARRLRLQAVTRNIIRESFDEFSTRVINCILNFSVQEINKIIDSMDKRIGLVISSKGQRIKY